MGTAAKTLLEPHSPSQWLWMFLKEELAPYPGRTALVARMTVAVTLVMIINMIYRIPYGAYGAIYALIISREDLSTTVNAVRTIIIAFALSVLYIFVGAVFFLQDPNLRLFWVVATLFLMFYTLSAASDYTAAARFGYLLVITIPLWDRQIRTELKVEQTLWAFGAISLASLITIAVELIYASLRLRQIPLQPVIDRIAAVEDLLCSYAAGLVPDETMKKKITRFSLAGGSALRRMLQRSAYLSQYREETGALISLVGRLVDIAANMIQFTSDIPDQERSHLRRLIACLSKIRNDLTIGNIPHLEPENDAGTLHLTPLLAEMERTVALIPEVFAGSLSFHGYGPHRASGDRAFSLFKPDALTNSDHFKFGLKGCFAASLCYLFYNAKGWPGINTAITTCLLTALTTVGSSHQKQVLRFAGAIVGGIGMGIGAEVYILPALDSIAGFTLVVIAATVIAAWIATSSPRLSYFGIQIAVAFYLINLSEFHLQTSLVPARDRVLGILLGLLMMWLVFDQLWGASAAVVMKKTFISNFRLVAQLVREPMSKDLKTATARGLALRETINANLDKVRALGDGVLFEFGPSREQDLALRDRIRRWQPNLRMLFITRLVLWRYRVGLPGFELPEGLQPAHDEFDNCIATALERMADRLEGDGSTQKDDLTSAYGELDKAASTASLKSEHQLTPHIRSLVLLSHRTALLANSLEKDI